MPSLLGPRVRDASTRKAGQGGKRTCQEARHFSFTVEPKNARDQGVALWAFLRPEGACDVQL